MSIFWIVSLILIAISLLVLLWPFIKKGNAAKEDLDQSAMNVDIAKERLAELDRDLAEHRISQEEHIQIKEELESALYFDLEKQNQKDGDDSKGTWALFLILIFVPAFSIFMYQSLGSPEGLKMIPGQHVETAAEVNHNAAMTSIKDRLIALVEKLKKEPKNVTAWMEMGQIMMRIDRYKEAVMAYNKVLTLSDFEGTKKADVLVALADAVAMEQGGKLDGEADDLIAEALKLDANHTSALWLAGMSAERKNNHELALSYWNKLYLMLSDTDVAKATLATLIQDARNAMSGIAKAPAKSMVAVTSPASLKLKVTITDELKAKINGNELLFIYAKAMAGPPMPLAALKLKASDLPVEVTLDDNMAMMPQMKLSSFPTVKVGARVSKSGQPISQVGDFQGEVQNVVVKGNHQTINVVISSVKQ